MITQEKLKLELLDEKMNGLYNKTFALLKEFGKLEILKELNSELKRNKERSILKIAFVGQYNAGKSTLISALTGSNEIKIDSNVATEASQEYLWNNVHIVDTPGILAGKVEKHDEITLQALKEADLIVYVLTSQLFDDLTFNNFIHLAFEEQFKEKMMITVNKMSMESGDFQNLVHNYRESLQSTFLERGYDFDFEVVFTDAADYLEGKEENEVDLLEFSNFNEFVKALNNFSEDKGFLSKNFDTPLRLMRNGLRQAIVQEEDPDFALILNKFERRLRIFRKELVKSTEYYLDQLQDEIITAGYGLTADLGEIDKEKFERLERSFEATIQEKATATMDQIQNLISDRNKELREELKEVSHHEDVLLYQENLKIQLKQKGDGPKADSTKADKWKLIEYLEQYSGKLSGFTGVDNAAGMFATAREVSGSQAHEFVKQAGHFIGHKFRPWEAVNITKNIGNVAQFAGPVLSLVTVGMEINGAVKEEKRIKEITKAKNQMNNEFFDLSKDIAGQIRTKFNKYLSETIDKKIEELETQRNEIVKKNEMNSAFSKAFSKLDAEYVDFIDIVGG